MAALVLTAQARSRAEQALLERIRQYGAALLEGYRLPTTADIQHDWEWVREETKQLPYRAAADFNGDGRQDYAFVLLGDGSYRVRVGALVSFGHQYRSFQLLDTDTGNEYSQHRYVVSVVAPGRYKQLEGPRFRLSRPAISIAYTESSDTFFVWDAKRRAFRSIPITD